MGNVIKFNKPRLSEKFAGNSLCKHGHHKWRIIKHNTFDSKQGRLVTTWQCSRCKKIRTKAI